MFDSIGWAEILVLIVIGLFVLGPERLPTAAAWAGRTVRQVREYAHGARQQLRSELGPEFDTLRKPLEDLRSIRDLNPRRMMSKHLLDDLDDFKPNGYLPSDYLSSPPFIDSDPLLRPLTPGERPPIDPDAT
jgi:sec-independent protein translocase protein TatB